MSVDILQRFIQLQLIKVQGDDTRLDKIRAAATALEVQIGDDTSKFLPALIAAADPNTPDATPAMKDAYSALEEKWNSFINVYASPPVEVFRAMLTHAAFAATNTCEEYVTSATLILRNIVPRRDFGAENTLWRDILSHLDGKYEQTATTVWADNFNGATGPVPKKPAEKTAKVDRGKLQLAMLGAAGPHGADSKPGTQPNPNWPSGNEQWATHFANRVSAGIGDAVDETVAAALQSRQTIDKAIFDILEQRLPNAESVQRRTRLLWWKEAAYSPVADRGYAEMSSVVAAITAAVDVHRMVPTQTPRSVEHFLRTIVNTRGGGAALTGAEWASALAAAEDRATAASALPAPQDQSDILSYALSRAAAKTSTVLPALYESGPPLTGGDLSVVIYRELQAFSALNADAA